jgi:hypothetical protein
MEYVELLVYLEELEGAASSPPFLFGLPVIDVLSNRRRRPVRNGETQERRRSWVERRR